MVRHRCASPSWSTLVVELRSVGVAVLRGALLGAPGPVTHGMGMLQMDMAGGQGEVLLPLLSCEGLMGSLRMHVQVPPQGVGTVRVQLLGCSSSLPQLTVRAVLFERFGDARSYLEAFQAGCAAPPCRGHVCARSSFKPWESVLEFRTAEAPQELFQEPLGSFAQGLPPSVAGAEEVAEQAKQFLKRLGH